MCVAGSTFVIAAVDPAAANAKLRNDNFRLTIRWGDVHQANLDSLKAADPALSARCSTMKHTPHSIFKTLFGTLYNQHALLFLLGSKTVPAWAPASNASDGRADEWQQQLRTLQAAHTQLQTDLQQASSSAAAAGARADALQTALDGAAARVEALSSELAAASGEAIRWAHAAPQARPVTHRSTTGTKSSAYWERITTVKSNIDEIIRRQAKCEAVDFFKEFYGSNNGYQEWAQLQDQVARWDGAQWQTEMEKNFHVGVATGTAAASDNFSRDKYESLYITDQIGLSERQIPTMLKLTGLSGHLAGKSKIAEARKEINGEIHQVFGVSPTPGGTGWQVHLAQLLKFIVYKAIRTGAIKEEDVPHVIQARITYDGAETAGHPGIIGYLVPLNLGLKVQSAHSAFPLFFCRCQESHENLKQELQDLCRWIPELESDGLSLNLGGPITTHEVSFTQSQDMASMWKQCITEEGTKVTSNCNAGACWVCGANKKNKHLFHKWRNWTLTTLFHIITILPIPKHKTLPCVAHGKFRVTEKLTTLLACTAAEAGHASELLDIIHQPLTQGGLGCDHVRIKKDGDSGKISVSTLYGDVCDRFVANGEALVARSGESNYYRDENNYHRYGSTDPEKKTIQQLKKWAQDTGHQLPPGSKQTKTELLELYYQCVPCAPACTGHSHGALEHQPDGSLKCPHSLHAFTFTGRANDVQTIWRLWGEIDALLRQLEPLTPGQITAGDAALKQFGDLYVQTYGAENVTDYVHMIVCHAVSFWQEHGCTGMHANQGAEAAHKIIRQTINHTARGGGQVVQGGTFSCP